MTDKNSKKKKGVKRRKFLKFAGSGLGLMVVGGWALRNPIRRKIFEVGETMIVPYQGNTNALVWLNITPKNEVILHSSKVEMGQGTFTGLAQLVAEELELDVNKIKVVHAQTGTGNIDQFGTGGSMSIASLWNPLRTMAAATREMLKLKASEKMGVAYDALTLSDGVFLSDGKSMTFGELVRGEDQWEIPEAPKLKTSDFKSIGKPIARVDLHDKVIGAPIFGMDASYPDMLYASIVKSTQVDAVMSDFDFSEAEKMPGVVKLVEEADFVGVIAESHVEAENARKKIKYSLTPNKTWNLADIQDAVKVGNGKKTIIQKQGEEIENIIEDGEVLEIEFRSPIGAHAQLEPNGAVADYRDGRVEIKVSTQVTKVTHDEVAKALGISKDKVNIIPTFLGGGFGRRLHTPHAAQAALMSKAVGKPVRLFLDRNQEFQNDMFRPPTHHILKAKLGADGNILGLEHQLASGSTLFGSAMDPGVAETILRADIGSIRGGAIMYDLLPHRFTYYHVDLPFATSFWRSLGLLPNAFAIESFIDEMALKIGKNPVQLRLDAIDGTNSYGARSKKVLELCAEKAGYMDSVQGDRAMGIALSIDTGSPCAMVAEVSLEGSNIKIHKVTAVLDCGLAVNPDQVRAQVEGCICMGISASMFEKMQLKDNELLPKNFGHYQMAMMRHTPREIDVHLIQGMDEPGPVGEPPLGPIAPAISNALRRLTGKRITELPMKLG